MSILSFYSTVVFAGCFAKKTLKNLLHRERLLITQETLRISLFASTFLSLVKKTALHFLFTALSYMQGALQKRRVWKTSSQRISNAKLRNIADIGIQSCVTKFSQKCFILSVYCTALCTERFEPPHSLSTSKKNYKYKYKYTLQILIFDLIILNVVKKLLYTSISRHGATYRVLKRNLR